VTDRDVKSKLDVSGFALPRRKLLRGGLAGLATALVSPALSACGDDGAVADASVDTGVGTDTSMDALPDTRPPMDAAPDAGYLEFPDRTVPAAPELRSLIADIGYLGDPDENGVRLPPGFTSRVLAVTQQTVGDSDYVWHFFPDGGATFATEDDGWIYVSNSETPILGGVGALRFDAAGALVDAYPILEGSNINCAGGRTPWHTWLSCEEASEGKVWECDPWGEMPAQLRPALGIFKHEAVAVDTIHDHLFLTEDQDDGGFYRYVPDGTTDLGRPHLGNGRLEVAQVDSAGAVTWLPVPDPQITTRVATREQVPEMTPFDGGEGVWFHDGIVYFSTKGDTRIWAYDVTTYQLSVIYDGEAIADPPLTGVDNITVSCCGDVLVAEDGGSMQIVAILPSGELKPLMQIVGQDSSEITGPAFDPSGTRLYFSSQRGSDSNGITFVIEGPFHEPA